MDITRLLFILAESLGFFLYSRWYPTSSTENTSKHLG